MGLPGSMRFWMPSRPAINIAANADIRCTRDPANETRLALRAGSANTSESCRGRGGCAAKSPGGWALGTRAPGGVTGSGRGRKARPVPRRVPASRRCKAAELAELGILRAVEEVGFAFPNALMHMHARG